MASELLIGEKVTFPQVKSESPFRSDTESTSSNDLAENELMLIELLGYWIPKDKKLSENFKTPRDHEELISFIRKLFELFNKEEKDCWSQLNNLHLLTPQMLHLYQKKFIQVQSMNWIQLLCYKAVSCPKGRDCQSYREQKMLNNQFYDFELECPFFHNSKDRRRIVLPLKPDEEFTYKGKYQEGEGSQDGIQNAFSMNYFESVYHPLFYKFFNCKRLQCKGSIYCPMKHSEEEKVVWEEEFSLNWKKDRSIYYPKKNKSGFEFSGFAPEEEQYGKTHRYNNYSEQRNGLNSRYNGKPQYKGNFNGMKLQNKHRDFIPQKQFNQKSYGPQYLPMGEQAYETPSQSGYYRGAYSYENQFAFWHGNGDWSNTSPANNGYTPLAGYYGSESVGYESAAPLTKTSSKTLFGSIENLNQSQNYLGGPTRSNSQSQDDKCEDDFENIFSSINQISRDFECTLEDPFETPLGRKELSPGKC